MKKLTLLFLSFFVFTLIYAQNDRQVSEKMFQKNSKIYNPYVVNSFKSLNNNSLQTPKATALDEGFEGTTFPPTGWTVQNGTSTATYQWKKGTSGHTGSSCAMVEYDPALVPQNEWLISPSLNLTTLTVPVLEFWWSMSYYWGVSPNNNYDVRVKVSTNGGTSWSTIWTEDSAGEFSSFTYQKAAIMLTDYATATNLKVAFQYQGVDGAAIYLDDITVGDLTPHRLDFQEIWSGFVTFDPPYEWSGYTQIPLGQSLPASFAADIKNTGSQIQNNVKLTVKELTTNTSLSSTNTPSISIAFQQHDTAEVNSVVTIANQGNYKFVMLASSDSVPGISYRDTAIVVVNSDVQGLYSRDNNNFDGWRTWNGATSGNVDTYQIGNIYEFTSNTNALSISCVIASGTTVGAKTKAYLYEGWTRNLIAESDYHIVTANDINNTETTNPVELNLPFTNGLIPQLKKDSVYLAAIWAEGGSDSLWLAIGSTNQQPDYCMYIFDTDNKWYYYSKGNSPSMVRLHTSTATGINENNNTPFTLFQNMPNPANETTKISYQLNKKCDVTLSITDLTGRQVLTINKGNQNEGYFSEEINVSKLSAGTYFYTLKAGENMKTRKLIVR